MQASHAHDADQPRLERVTCLSPAGLHHMAYWEWGDPANDKVLVCVHGLTRTGRDFDRLARRMCGEYRVVCPDLAGRGRSAWLVDPAYYVVPQYVSDMMPLLARINARTVHWVGTSLGGLVGMCLAGLPDAPIDRLVLNDVGPRIEPAALARIAMYVGRAGSFASFEAAVEYVRTVSASFGPHTDEEWRELSRHAVRQETPDGPWTLHYDPSIALAFKPLGPEILAVAEAAMWQTFEAIACPVLLLRGEQSDLVSLQTADDMMARNPRAERVEIAGVGHAPTLMNEMQLGTVERFLLAG